MPDPYETLSVRGDRWPENRRMHVLLYPNTPAERGACEPGATIPTALRDAGDQLFDADAVSYYRIGRFAAERDAYSYPRVGPDNVDHEFGKYLRGEEPGESWCDADDCGTLLPYRGVHLLVHRHGFGTSLAGAASDDCEAVGGSAFSRGAPAWTSADDGSGAGITRNSAVQETVHLFVRSGLDSVKPLFCDVDGDGEKTAYEEHSLGAVDESGAASPMLTYHVEAQSGCNRPDRTWDGGYTTELTPETKAAVYRTSVAQCRPQPGVSRRPGESHTGPLGGEAARGRRSNE